MKNEGVRSLVHSFSLLSLSCLSLVSLFFSTSRVAVALVTSSSLSLSSSFSFFLFFCGSLLFLNDRAHFLLDFSRRIFKVEKVSIEKAAAGQ